MYSWAVVYAEKFWFKVSLSGHAMVRHGELICKKLKIFFVFPNVEYLMKFLEKFPQLKNVKKLKMGENGVENKRKNTAL